uniref:Sialin n=1 Tax=Schmidtea mediterranea TaxID=79327 RepID=A0A0H3YJ16_SCHMD|nr:slc17a-3 [Schmidtea mediterranea]
MTDKSNLLNVSNLRINYYTSNENYDNLDENSESPKEKWYNRFCIPTRYVIAVWGFLGFAVVYALRVNLSVAILAMVNNSAIKDLGLNLTPECPNSDSAKVTKDGEFVWDQNIQGLVLGAFFWGYIPLQIPAGAIAVKVGGKWFFGIGVLWTSLLTLLTPVAARLGYGWLIGLRILEGAGESITYPAMHTMLGYWAPVMETTFIGGIVYSGSFAGLVIGLLASAQLIESNVMGGWPSVFYIPGIIGIVWFIIWSFVAFSTPANHPRITMTEKRFIESSVNLSSEERHSNVPWKSILLSLPVWAISVANFCSMWSLYTLLTSLPLYFEHVLGFSIAQNGYLNALPYLLSAIVFVVSGKIADIIRSRKWLSTTVTRKLFNTFGMMINAIFIVAISYIGCDKVLVVTFLCIAVALGTTNSAGYNVNHIDLAPQYAGVLYGITNSIATVAGIIGPSVVGVLTNHQETRKRWQIVFYISSAITLFGAIFFLIFGSGDRQSWAIEKSEIEIEDQNI